MPGQLNLRIKGTQRAGVQQSRDRVEHRDQAGAVADDDVLAHQGSDVLGRLQPAVVGQDDQVPRRMPGSVVNSSATPAFPASRACRVSGPPASSGMNALNRSP